MADLPISGLTAAGTLAGTEPLPIVQGGATKKTTVQDVADLGTYTKDADDNVFYKGVTATLGASCEQNIFHQGAIATFGDNCSQNIIYQGSVITFGDDCNNNDVQGTGFIFANNLQRTTILHGSIGANYTNLTNYGFLYSLPYPSEIFRNSANTANYHRYYDTTNDRIVLTNLTTLAVSYIGGGSWASTLVSTSQTAANNTQYIVVANATFTDPTPVEGKGFKVYVRNGTATVGGTAYSSAGSVIWRVFHSGSWANYYSSPYNDATSSIQTQLNSKTDTFTLLSIIGTWASPADSLSYYAPIIGGVTTPTTTITTYLSSFSFATKIIGIYVQHINNSGTQGSNENVAFQIRNNTTSTSTQLINIQTNQASGVQKNFEDYSLNVAIAANDQIALQINTPAWATNPTNAIFRVSLFIQRT